MSELLARRSKVAFLVEIDSSIRHPKGPNSDVKFSSSVKHWSFKVLLNDPFVSHGLGMDELDNVFDILKDFNTSPLV